MVEERKRYILEFPDIPTERQRVQELPVEERISDFNEVDLGFTEDAAIEEARRCLSCRRCLGCGLCLAECEKEAIDFEQADERIDISVDSVIITPGARRDNPLPPGKFGYGRYGNVVTDVEFERILSDRGPYGGLLIRPFDGEIPGRIGFICWDNGDESGAGSLNYALSEAVLARKKVEGLEISLFCLDKDEYLEELERNNGGAPGITIRKGEVTAVREVLESKNLTVQWSEDGDVIEEEFEMVVVSTTPELPGYIVELAKRLNIDLKDVRTDILLSETSREGVFFAGGM